MLMFLHFVSYSSLLARGERVTFLSLHIVLTCISILLRWMCWRRNSKRRWNKSISGVSRRLQPHWAIGKFQSWSNKNALSKATLMQFEKWSFYLLRTFKCIIYILEHVFPPKKCSSELDCFFFPFLALSVVQLLKLQKDFIIWSLFFLSRGL